MLQAGPVSGTVHVFVFSCAPCGVQRRVEKKGTVLAQQQVVVLNSQQWPVLFSSFCSLGVTAEVSVEMGNCCLSCY